MRCLEALAGLCLIWVCGAAAADDPGRDAESWAIHGQLTYTEQETSGFHAPYAGPNSLSPSRGAQTVDATLYVGARPWSEIGRAHV